MATWFVLINDSSLSPCSVWLSSCSVQCLFSPCAEKVIVGCLHWFYFMSAAWVFVYHRDGQQSKQSVHHFHCFPLLSLLRLFLSGWFCVSAAWNSQPFDLDNYTNANCLCPATSTGGRCQVGFYCPLGSSEPLPCPPGTFCNISGIWTLILPAHAHKPLVYNQYKFTITWEHDKFSLSKQWNQTVNIL